jgi:bacteriocin biosynthesis cyclodehydratase domain-containing protein
MRTDSPPALPARLRLPPHRSVLRLGADGRLLGLEPGRAIAVDGLCAGLAAMLDELVGPIEPAGAVARAMERGADPQTAADLLRELVEVGALVDAGDEERRARQRRDSVVLVVGAGPLAVGVVVGLARAGVGAVVTATGGRVRAADLGTGYLDADLGRDRVEATQAAVRRMCPDAAAPAVGRRVAPDLVVLADALAPEPARIAALHGELTPHLPVRLRDGIGLIGPLVLPGRTTCLRCLELHRRARAPEWPQVSAQLNGLCGQAGSAETSATAALATAQVLAALDALTGAGGEPPTLETTIELHAVAGTITRRRWAPLAECGCGAPTPHRARAGGPHHGAVTSADQRDGETIMV